MSSYSEQIGEICRKRRNEKGFDFRKEIKNHVMKLLAVGAVTTEQALEIAIEEAAHEGWVQGADDCR